MISKETFICKFSQYENNDISKLYNKIILAERTNKIIYTKNFLTLSVFNILKAIEGEMKIKVYCFGVFEEFDRAMLAFSCYDEENLNYPIDVLKITNKSKFKELKHSDYLGAIMSLGIDRELLGDIVVKENCAYVPVVEDISDYIIYNLSSIGKSPCSITKLEDYSLDLPKISFEEKSIIVSSLRVDNVVSALCNISRSKALELIEQKKVFLNYIEILRKDKLVNLDDTLTIRGYGKFKICNFLGKTQRERIKVLMKKYN